MGMAYGSRVTWKKGIPMANSSDRQYRLPDKPEEYQEDSSYPETGETMAAEEMKIRPARPKIGIGYRVGSLTVEEGTDQRKNGYLVWRCRCGCGGWLWRCRRNSGRQQRNSGFGLAGP